MRCKKLYQGSKPKLKDDVSLKKKTLRCQVIPRGYKKMAVRYLNAQPGKQKPRP
jgi:hypothetical protein